MNAPKPLGARHTLPFVPRALIVMVLAIFGCALVPNTGGTLHWDVDTGEVDCGVRAPVGATSATVMLGILAGYGAYKVHHPDVQQRDQYGYPSNVALGPDFYRGVEYFAGATALVSAAVSVPEWVSYARCSGTADLVHAIVTARDCATVRRLERTSVAAIPTCSGRCARARHR